MFAIPVIGKGRIVILEGASLWMLDDGQHPAELLPHSHHAIQITFCLRGSFEIGVAGQSLPGPIAAVGSDVPHTFRANGAAAFLFIAPESSIGRMLGNSLLAGQPWTTVESGPLAELLDDLRDCHKRGGTEENIRILGRQILERFAVAEDPVPPDPRVLAMIDFARSNLDDTVSLPAAAECVFLSPSRARHLFVANTGLPFKAFVLWLRLERAVALFAAGHTLTKAAHDAGFSDSAHFSRTFKRTFGLPAAGLRLLHD